MTIIHTVGTQRQIEETHLLVRPLFIDAFKAKYPTAKTRMQRGYKDRISDETNDTILQLSTDGKDHSDRFYDYSEHPNWPTTNQCLISFDDSKITDDLNHASYINEAARERLGADPDIIDVTTEEAKELGFFPEEER